MARRRPPTVHGLVLVDKPAGMTSHDAVARLRRTLGERRVGHAGTLDPGATGVLVVGVGNGTRLMRYLSGLDKEYTCEIVFGIETDTLDDEGRETARHDGPPPSLDRARRAVSDDLVGAIMQVPPMVSAIKVGGRRLHELAREGVEIEREPRPVTVSRFDLEQTPDPAVFRARIECSTGTYVRVLGADLGRLLGTGAHIRGLRRTRVGSYGIAECRPLDDPVVLDVIEALRGVDRVVADEGTMDDIAHGRPLPCWEGGGPWALVDADGRLLAVYDRWHDQLAKPTVVLTGN